MTAVVVSVMAAAVELSFLRMMLPVPVVPPEAVSTLVPATFWRVVLVLLAVIAPLTVKAEVVLLRIIAVTLAPTPALMVVVLVFVPWLVKVPVILTAVV